jgi:hypothetical protein
MNLYMWYTWKNELLVLFVLNGVHYVNNSAGIVSWI